MNQDSSVQVRTETVVIPTYLPALPDKNPMFLEKRVYQGSNGKVYPLPFTDRIAEEKTDRAWKAVWIENEYLKVLILPELGGRIHAIHDKTNGYDLIYNQAVIKPALVGLAGPWASGGIEFNWPQHHRPATFLPVDIHIEESDDGAKTVWCSDHDPMARMKGMHGVCLHPGSALVELRVQAYNRTTLPQTFLWWANVATRVNEHYKSFFPPDVTYVADHAKRATSEYPLCQDHYYGVDYGKRGRTGVPSDKRPAKYIPPHCGGNSPASYAANDLSYYANIPVPTSYMCMGSKGDFFGGYDHKAEAGIIHVANHHISPGKKQWTWGNHPFGYAWDRNLTDADASGEYAPYIEIMAGVYTDNQPDFSFLQPGETKTWSQYWYPIQKIGSCQQANVKAALSLSLIESGKRSGRRSEKEDICRIGVAVTRVQPKCTITLWAKGKMLASFSRDLLPGAPLVETVVVPKRTQLTGLTLTVRDGEGVEVISYTPNKVVRGEVPPPATEPAMPAGIASADELFLTGLHLEQYRHATRCPTLYWREALRRDPGDSRSNHALGLWHLRRGEFAVAEDHFRRAQERLTFRNPNPADGETSYHLGLCLLHQFDSLPTNEQKLQTAKMTEAYAAFYKATWNQASAASAFHALAEIDCRRGDWELALEHLKRSLRWNTDNLRARDLKVVVLRRLCRTAEAQSILSETLLLDPLDWWARHLRGDELRCDAQIRLDLAHDYARAGLIDEAIQVLTDIEVRHGGELPDQSWGSAPLVHYTLGWLYEKRGMTTAAQAARKRAASASPDYCFPSRMEDIAILEAARRAAPKDARAPYYLGNLYFDRRRHAEAIALWERSTRLDPSYSVAWRNLGIGYFNISKKPAKARAAYARALRAAPSDARILFESDQLAKRLGVAPARRLSTLRGKTSLVATRDDLSLEYCSLLNQNGLFAEALELISKRNFQPWEGGEGQALGQHVRTHLALGRSALTQGRPTEARDHFSAALTAPANLGEARHLLANQSDAHYWLGQAFEALGEATAAKREWTLAADFSGDFQGMSVRCYSEMTYYSALALQRLGLRAKAKKVLSGLLKYAKKLAKTPAPHQFFSTTRPPIHPFY